MTKDEEIAALRAQVAALTAELDAAKAAGWIPGEPPKPWRDEWFIAKTIHGEKVVLRSLPEEWSYDYTTADHTYMVAANIVCWMQFPDSEYVAPVSDEALIRAALDHLAYCFTNSQNLERQICCNGIDCGCQGATAEDYVVFTIRALATPEGIAAIRERAKG
jgi:hypothetical protein